MAFNTLGSGIKVHASPVGDAAIVLNDNFTLANSHIANTSNPHSVTAAQVGALALTGGTLTGSLSGTSATFSGDVTGSSLIANGSGYGIVLNGMQFALYSSPQQRHVHYVPNGGIRYQRTSDDANLGNIDNSGNLTITGGGTFGGNVGIGTATPTTAKLVISGTAATQGLDLSTGDMYANLRVIQNTNSSIDKDIYLGYNGNVADGSKIRVYSNGAATMIVSGGYVGIGTTSPAAPLNVVRSSGNPSWIRCDSGSYFNEFGVVGSSSQFVSGSVAGDAVFKFTGGRFLVTNGTAVLQSIDGSTGCVGFGGVASPIYPLHLNGTVAATAFVHTSGYFGLDTDSLRARMVRVDNTLAYDNRAYVEYASCDSMASYPYGIYSFDPGSGSGGTIGWLEAIVTAYSLTYNYEIYIRKVWRVRRTTLGTIVATEVESVVSDPSLWGAYLQISNPNPLLSVEFYDPSFGNTNVSTTIRHKFDYPGSYGGMY